MDHCARAGRASAARTSAHSATRRVMAVSDTTRACAMAFIPFRGLEKRLRTQTRRHCELRALVLWNTRDDRVRRI